MGLTPSELLDEEDGRTFEVVQIDVAEHRKPVSRASLTH